MSTPDQRITVADRPDRDQYEIEFDGERVGRLSLSADRPA